MKLLLLFPALLLLAAAPAAQPATGDHAFIRLAYSETIAQLKAAQLGRDLAADPMLKNLAMREIAINQKLYDRLRDLDQGRAAVRLQDELTPWSQIRLEQLQNMQGLSFEDAFISDQIAAHQRMIALYDREIREGNDPAVIAYAQRQLPDLQDQLIEFQSLTTRKPAG